MTEIEIFTQISKMKVENLMRHADMADVMDFMNLHGFKRQAEYHYFKENIALRKLHRYAINHFNTMIYDLNGINIRLKPQNWQGHTRSEVDESLRKKYAKQFFYDWRDWEKQAKIKLQQYYNEMLKLDVVASKEIYNMLCDVEEELKYLERDILKYDAVNWDTQYLMYIQDDIHECYREKELKIDFR